MKKMSNITFGNSIIISLLTCLLLGACNLNDINQREVTRDDVLGAWIPSCKDAGYEALQSKEILIFCGNYYTRIIRNASPSKEKYKYTAGRDGKDIVITPETFPNVPPFKISYEQDSLIMRQQWPPALIINKGMVSYKKISEEDAENILKIWRGAK